MNDSDRNILASLRHEPCEAHCDECGRCDWEPTGPTTTAHIEMTEVDNGHSITTYCPDCLPNQQENTAMNTTTFPAPDPTTREPDLLNMKATDALTVTVERYDTFTVVTTKGPGFWLRAFHNDNGNVHTWTCYHGTGQDPTETKIVCERAAGTITHQIDTFR